MRPSTILSLSLAAGLLAIPAAHANGHEPAPLCDGVKQPTGDGPSPDKASGDPLCDGVKQPTGDGPSPDKA
jgi:hypothetical protein